MQIKPETVMAWGMVVGPFMTGVLGVITVVIGNRAKRASDKAERSADVAAIASDKAAEVADKTHMLVNSQMGQQLMMYSITARTLANLTHDLNHKMAADEADRKLQEHIMKQHMVDRKEAQDG